MTDDVKKALEAINAALGIQSTKPTDSEAENKKGSSEEKTKGLNMFEQEAAPKSQEQLRKGLDTNTDSILNDEMLGVGNESLSGIDPRLARAGSNIENGYNANQLYSNYGKDTIKNDPYGNLNNLSFNDTLDLSRRTDTLNNMVRRDPVSIGHRTNSSYGSQGIAFNDRQKNEGIETQEQRQMRMNEQLAQQRQSQTVSLLGDLDRYPLELRQQIDAARVRVAELIGTNEANLVDAFRRAIMDLAYVQTGQMTLQQAQAKFLMYLALNAKSRVVQKVYQLFQSDPELARLMGNAMGAGGDINAINMAIGNSQGWRNFIEKLNAGERDEAYRALQAVIQGAAAVGSASNSMYIISGGSGAGKLSPF